MSGATAYEFKASSGTNTRGLKPTGISIRIGLDNGQEIKYCYIAVAVPQDFVRSSQQRNFSGVCPHPAAWTRSYTPVKRPVGVAATLRAHHVRILETASADRTAQLSRGVHVYGQTAS